MNIIVSQPEEQPDKTTLKQENILCSRYWARRGSENNLRLRWDEIFRLGSGCSSPFHLRIGRRRMPLRPCPEATQGCSGVPTSQKIESASIGTHANGHPAFLPTSCVCGEGIWWSYTSSSRVHGPLWSGTGFFKKTPNSEWRIRRAAVDLYCRLVAALLQLALPGYLALIAHAAPGADCTKIGEGAFEAKLEALAIPQRIRIRGGSASLLWQSQASSSRLYCRRGAIWRCTRGGCNGRHAITAVGTSYRAHR